MTRPNNRKSYVKTLTNFPYCIFRIFKYKDRSISVMYRVSCFLCEICEIEKLQQYSLNPYKLSAYLKYKVILKCVNFFMLKISVVMGYEVNNNISTKILNRICRV